MTARFGQRAAWHQWAVQAVVALLLLTNPLIIALFADSQALLLAAGLALVFMATGLLPRTGLQQASVLSGASLAALYLSSVYSILFMPFLISGLVIIMPRRHLHRHTFGFLVVLLMPVILAVLSAAYLDFLGALDRTDAIFHARDWFAARQPLPGADLWLSRYGGHFQTAAAGAIVWTVFIAPLPVVRLVTAWGQASARHAGFVIISLILAPAIAANFSLPVSPLVFFGAMLAANIPFIPVVPARMALTGLGLALAGGQCTVWLYAS
ncbi:hypothetical protein [Aquisalinus flavus]|uniref:Uncharacterized protein n=1 Tax=Aquisalinus flavus TaxID=1526572 RepID=A0A8J2V3J9_9PROT|nr:hypothetical protein [Aquisalinus flavus]MBD0425722.1 hypothetical protein [Aquisalinus flavus]UNE48668.1 hypothetical protein FF099_11715 [Aquisalinus flavus]GGD13784.1 hypothetical protein GCM10011342_23190 [Aquisalinus flavus]